MIEKPLDCLLLIEHFVVNSTAVTPGVCRLFLDFVDSLPFEYLPLATDNVNLETPGPTLHHSSTAMTLGAALSERGLMFVCEEGTQLATYAEQRIKHILMANRPPVLAISTSYNINPPIIADLIDLARRQGYAGKIVLGGQGLFGLTLSELSNRFPHADLFLVGDGEAALPEVVDRARNGFGFDDIAGAAAPATVTDCNMAPMPAQVDLDAMPLPDFRMQKTSASGVDIEEGRGCVFRCSFCTYHINNAWRRKSVDRLMAELRAARDAGWRDVHFCGAEITTPRNQTAELCRRLISENLGLSIRSYARLDVLARHPELANIMKEAGWKAIFFGLESGDPTVLNNMNKRYDVDRIPDAAHYLQETLGIDILASFVVGFPGETDASLDRTKALLKASRFRYVSLDGMLVLQNTPLLYDGHRFGLVVDHQTGAWRHRTMSSSDVPDKIADLLRFCLEETDSCLVAFDPLLTLMFGAGHGLMVGHKLLRQFARTGFTNGFTPIARARLREILRENPRTSAVAVMNQWLKTTNVFNSECKVLVSRARQINA